VTSSVPAGAAQLSAFFRRRVTTIVELLGDVSVTRGRRHAAGLLAADTSLEAAGDAISPAWTGQLPMTTVDSRLSICLGPVDVPSRHLARAGVVLRLALETFATGQQTEHAA